ncbi:DHH family protein-like protein [Calycina marina]|uniref:DHH family protein-like protein n=1 Tax=Calycina marina TaxID=1763456 RepID=A0A9P8CJ48_9HELO|nr:DHH family protein-like protein [Calycina marina]
MKRKAGTSSGSSKRKAIKLDGYCNASPKLDEHNNVIWPAPGAQLDRARGFSRKCAKTQKPTLIVPDKNADVLTSGIIAHRTLVKPGLDPEWLEIHLLWKGSNIHEQFERGEMLKKKAKYIIVLDQGSRGAPPFVDDPETKYPDAMAYSSSILESKMALMGCIQMSLSSGGYHCSYHVDICKALDRDISSQCRNPCTIGICGDLGNTLKWLPPFPDMTETLKNHTKKSINDCVTGKYNVITAWKALLEIHNPKEVLKNGKIGVLKINSKAQVHTVIATRCASHLKSKAPEIVMAANYSYLPGRVIFSRRIACIARDPPVNITKSLKAVASFNTAD